MALGKWTKRILWTVAVLGLVGVVGIYRVFQHFYPPLETIIIVENRTINPVNVVSLTHDGKVLMRDPSFTHIGVFPDLSPSQDEVEVRLVLKRTDGAEPETHVFTAEQGEYFERCAFQVLVLNDGVEMSGCFDLR